MFDVRVHGRASAQATGTAELLAGAAVFGGRPAKVLIEPDFGPVPGRQGSAVRHCLIDDGAGGLRPGSQVDGLIVMVA